MREKILELLKQAPFQPFRIYLSNGTIHTIRHPEQVMISQTYLIIGIPASETAGPEIIDSVFVSLVHVVQVELFSPTASTSQSNGK